MDSPFYYGDEEIITLLNARSKLYDAPASQLTIQGVPALGFIAAFGEADTLRALVQAGADIDECDFEGRTALIRAAARKNTDCLKVLLDLGAKTELATETEPEKTALQVARDRNNQEGIKMLLAAKKRRQEELLEMPWERGYHY